MVHLKGQDGKVVSTGSGDQLGMVEAGSWRDMRMAPRAGRHSGGTGWGGEGQYATSAGHLQDGHWGMRPGGRYLYRSGA